MTLIRTINALLAVILLLCMTSAASGAPISNSLPSKIITTDGNTYHDVELIKAEPDGLVIQYAPRVGGIGLATLKFSKLPESLQKQFNYNPTNASEFERNQAVAAAALSEQLRKDENISAETQMANARPNFIWHISEPIVIYSNYDSTGPKPAVFDSQPSWVTGITVHHFTCDPDFTFYPLQNESNGCFSFSFETINISLGLVVTIYLPMNPYASLKAHEEGHRKICENFYKLGQPVAQMTVEALVKRDWSMYGTDAESARRNAANYVKRIIQVEYEKRIEQIAKDANVRYDKLTDHGRNFVQPNDAAQQVTDGYERKVWMPDEVTDLSSSFNQSQ